MPEIAAQSKFIELVKAGNLEEVTRLLDLTPALVNAQDSTGNSAVILALYYGQQEIARLLVSRRATLNIFDAAALGDLGQVQTLLQSQPNLSVEFAPDGFTALQLAAFFGHIDILEYLIEHGASMEAVARNTQRITALHAAAAHHNPTIATQMVGLLVSHHADVNASQEGGYTPLHEAAQSGNREMIRLLYEHDPNIALTDSKGRTALDIALENHHADAAELLESYAANGRIR